MLILPNLGTLALGDVDVLDPWAATGSRLIATGSSGAAEDDAIQVKFLPAEREDNLIGGQDLLWS